MAKGTLDDIVQGISVLTHSRETAKENQAHNEIQGLYSALDYVQDPVFKENPEFYNVIRTDPVQRGIVAEAVESKVKAKLGQNYG